MRFSIDEIVAATHGHRTKPAPQSSGSDIEMPVDSISIDSRRLSAGSLFVPLVGDRDGHGFIAAAIAAGAIAYLSERACTDQERAEQERAARERTHQQIVPTEVRVHSTTDALSAIGRHARARLERAGAGVVGITGSSGKTSTKDLLAAVLRRRGPVGASELSFNNELGVPLTLANTPDDAWAAVIEMGARGAGHIEALCEIARPTVGVITNIGTAHLEHFGSTEGIARAKGELIEALPSNGHAVLNRDDDGTRTHEAGLVARTRASVLWFGESSACDIRAEQVSLDTHLRPSFLLRSPWGSCPVTVEGRGRHMVANALAAAGASLALGMQLEDVAAGLADAAISPWRMELVRTAGGSVIINDAYNANPGSMAAGLDALAAVDARRRIAVLGPMAELGPDAARLHRNVVERAAAVGIDAIVAVDAPGYAEPAGATPTATGPKVVAVSGHDEALAVVSSLTDRLHAGTAVLVKGSRVAGLETLAERLVAEGGGRSAAVGAQVGSRP